MPLSKIISGAQSGVDRGALDAALALGFPCGGSCPKGRLAEDGRISDLYPLTELESPKYRARTIKNVLDSNATPIIYFSNLSGGTEQTMFHCIKNKKPYKTIDAAAIHENQAARLAALFIAEMNVSILNVAGPRASQQPLGYNYAFNVVYGIIRAI